MAGRLIAQLLVAGGTMLFRAATQAYQQALVNAHKAGGAEALKRAARTGNLTLEEARQILGVEPGATWEQIEKKYDHLFKVNKETSHYLQSKVFRAKELMDHQFPEDSRAWKDKHETSTSEDKSKGESSSSGA